MKILLAVTTFLVYKIEPGTAITCYVCTGSLNNCTIGLLGERIDCGPEIKSCYKSRTVEAMPMVVRKCGFAEEIDKENCIDSNNGYTNMERCLCKTGLCNGAGRPAAPIGAIAAAILLKGFKDSFSGINV